MPRDVPRSRPTRPRRRHRRRRRRDRRRMDGIGPARRRPLAGVRCWPGRSDASPPRRPSPGSSSWRPADRVGRRRPPRPGAPRRRGRRRRRAAPQESVHAGSAALEPPRARRPGPWSCPRRRAPLVTSALVDRWSRPPAAPNGRGDPDPPGRRDAQADRRRAGRRDGRPLRARRRPDPAGRAPRPDPRRLRNVPAGGPETWTDEASLLEAREFPVGRRPRAGRRPQVTIPADLPGSRRSSPAPPRSARGIGHDSHPFGPGGPLRWAAWTIAGAPRLYGIRMATSCSMRLPTRSSGRPARAASAASSRPTTGRRGASRADELRRRVLRRLRPRPAGARPRST